MSSEDVIQSAAETAAQTAHQMANAGNGFTGLAGVWTLWSGLSLNDWGVIVGILGVVVGTLITYFYKRKEVALKRHVAEQELLLELEKAGRERRAFELQMLKEHGPDWRSLQT